MDAPPITLFAKTPDPDGVRKLILAEHPDARVTETEDGGWSSIEVRRKRGFLRGEDTLSINHDPDYYGGASWNATDDFLLNLAVCALAVKSTSRGPVFFVQERTGWRGRRQ